MTLFVLGRLFHSITMQKSEGSVITELNSKANAMGHNVLLDAVFQLSYSSRAGG